MKDLLAYFAVSFSAVFFVVDPIGLVPVFLAVTANEDAARRVVTARRAALAATLLLLAFAVAGAVVFRLFGITLGAFKIAGGILLFTVALDMMRATQSRVRTTPMEEREGAEKADVALIPLAVPMLAGPGGIATTMVVMESAHGEPMKVAIALLVVVLTGVIAWLLLRSALLVEARLKFTGIAILHRLMGFLLAAVAVQFVVDGIAAVFPHMMGPLR